MTSNPLNKAINIALMIILSLGIIIAGTNYFLNKYSIPDKATRLYNLREYSGITELTQLSASDRASDIAAALSEYTNWDNLFLSEHFKEKYKNRGFILDDVNNIADINSGLDDEHGDNAVVIFAEKKSGLFDTDGSDDITTEYYFRYVLNEAGEIDELILLEKRDVYTINGMPVDSAENGWTD